MTKAIVDCDCGFCTEVKALDAALQSDIALTITDKRQSMAVFIALAANFGQLGEFLIHYHGFTSREIGEIASLHAVLGCRRVTPSYNGEEPPSSCHNPNPNSN